MKKNTSIILGNHFEEFVKQEVSSGRYASVSEVIRNGLRKLEEEKHYRSLIEEALIVGEQSGSYEPFDNEEFKKRMREKYEQKDSTSS